MGEFDELQGHDPVAEEAGKGTGKPVVKKEPVAKKAAKKKVAKKVAAVKPTPAEPPHVIMSGDFSSVRDTQFGEPR